MTAKDSEQPGKKDDAGDAASPEYLPPLDFSSIVLPLYAQALIKLGILQDPAGSGTGENLELARRLIDLLDLLKDRTRGNLKPEEEKFLETCLQQLHLGFVEKAKTRG
jgi:hypothetical protein